MLVKMAAVCLCSDSNHYRRTVFMALITALKAVFSDARRGLARFLPLFMRARVFCPCVRAYARANTRIRLTESAAKCSTGRVFGGADIAVASVLSCCFCAYYRRKAEQYPSRVALWDKFFAKFLTQTLRLRCGGNGVTEG